MTPSLRHADIPDSPPARWDTRWKLAAILVAVAGIAALNRLAPAAVALALGLILLAVSRLRWKWVRFRLSLFVLAALPFLLVLPFTLDGTGRYSERGLVAGLAVFCRGVAIGAFALVLVGTAPVHRTITAAHKLKVPGLLVLLALLAYRYAFLLADELRRLRVALRVRGFRATATRRGYRTLGHVAGAVLVRGADRADRVSDAMRCRGFDGQFHTLAAFRTTPADVVSFLFAVCATAALVAWDRLG
ncbi:MAG TPA: energy-coupling factor transporter transmembrane component T [Gemmataceae bacterium]|nr:energy-coupling factor transporter transmembrane component T [Gemmataceae bacterium]